MRLFSLGALLLALPAFWTLPAVAMTEDDLSTTASLRGNPVTSRQLEVCSNDSDCPPGYGCGNDVCVQYGDECVEDTDCQAAFGHYYWCDFGDCTGGGYYDDSCDSPAHCRNGLYCHGDSNIEGRKHCQDGRYLDDCASSDQCQGMLWCWEEEEGSTGGYCIGGGEYGDPCDYYDDDWHCEGDLYCGLDLYSDTPTGQSCLDGRTGDYCYDDYNCQGDLWCALVAVDGHDRECYSGGFYGDHCEADNHCTKEPSISCDEGSNMCLVAHGGTCSSSSSSSSSSKSCNMNDGLSCHADGTCQGDGSAGAACSNDSHCNQNIPFYLSCHDGACLPTPIEDGLGQIKMGSLCLKMDGSSPFDVHSAACTNAGDWSYNPETMQLMNTNTNKCMEVNGLLEVYGADCDEGRFDQKWFMDPRSHIRSHRRHNLCLLVSDTTTRLQDSSCHDETQQFTVPASYGNSFHHTPYVLLPGGAAEKCPSRAHTNSVTECRAAGLMVGGDLRLTNDNPPVEYVERGTWDRVPCGCFLYDNDIHFRQDWQLGSFGSFTNNCEALGGYNDGHPRWDERHLVCKRYHRVDSFDPAITSENDCPSGQMRNDGSCAVVQCPAGKAVESKEECALAGLIAGGHLWTDPADNKEKAVAGDWPRVPCGCFLFRNEIHYRENCNADSTYEVNHSWWDDRTLVCKTVAD